MTAKAPPPTPVRRWVVRAAGALLCLAAAAVAVVVAQAAGWAVPALDDEHPSVEQLVLGAGSLLLVTWAVAPLVAGAWLVRVVERTWPRGLGVGVVGAVVLTGLTVDALRGFLGSDSSTAALTFLFLPIVLWLALGLTIGIAALVDHGLDRWTTHRNARG